MKHKRTKAVDINFSTKLIVWNRDDKQCIFCEKYVPVDCANAHYIKRSQGGLGIPENIFTACWDCHWQEDAGQNQEEYRERAKKHLQSKYENWNEDDLYYDKWRDLNE